MSATYASRLELLKGAAFIAMVADHVDLALFDRSVPGLHAVGAFAFPAFCLTFGVGLAATTDPMRAVGRLLVPALVAQLAWFFIRPGHPANVLLMFALCALAARAAQARPAYGAAALAGLVLGGAILEGGPFGPLMVAAGYFAGRLDRPWIAMIAGASWCALLPSVGALLATVATYWCLHHGPVVRKLPGLPWAYAGHLSALALAATVTTSAPAVLTLVPDGAYWGGGMGVLPHVGSPVEVRQP